MYEELDVPSLVCLELFARRLARIKETLPVAPSRPDYVTADQFIGRCRRACVAAIAPASTALLSDQRTQESGVAEGARRTSKRAIASIGGTGSKGGKGGDGQAAARAADGQ